MIVAQAQTLPLLIARKLDWRGEGVREGKHQGGWSIPCLGNAWRIYPAPSSSGRSMPRNFRCAPDRWPAGGVSTPVPLAAPGRPAPAPDYEPIMNREMRHIAAERTVVMPIDELHRITVDQVGGVALLRWVDATVPPIVRQVVADRADEIDVTAVIADELVEAVVLRVIVLRVLGIAEMLLADDARGVPDGLRLFRQRDLTFLRTRDIRCACSRGG